MMLKAAYQRFFKKKFFNKIMLAYSAIILFALTLLAVFVSESTSAQLLEKELRYNTLVLHNVNDYIENKYNNVKKLFYQVYLDNDLYSPEVFDFLGNDIDKSGTEYIFLKKKFDNYFKSIFSRDNDIMDIIIYKKLDRSVYIYTRNAGKIYDESEFKYQERLSQIHEISSKLKIFPTFSPDYYRNGTGRVYTMTNNIKSLVTNENLGTMMIDFDPDGYGRAISRYAKDVKGDILVLTQGGEVLYDSSGRFYEMPYPYFKLLKPGANTETIDGRECITNLNSSNAAGVIVAGIIPKADILAGIETTKRTIYLIALLCVLMAVLLTIVVLSVFSKRVKTITHAMKTVHAGDLSNRVIVRASEDEIGEIAASYNKMCDHLDEYINKVYLSDIKQKSAELTALQAQVNPHFLYNTLEAIRMKALAGGDRETGNMIYILANLFRSTIKEETIVELADEIEYSKSYLELFKIRYGNKLKVEFTVEEEILHCGMIKHLIQPVIENYIVHGFDLRRTENCVKIHAYKVGQDIWIKISDNGIGIEKTELEKIQKELETPDANAKSSIGLRNANERIHLIYGIPFGMEIESVEGVGTTVTLKLAAKSKEELQKNVQSIDRGR